MAFFCAGKISGFSRRSDGESARELMFIVRNDAGFAFLSMVGRFVHFRGAFRALNARFVRTLLG